MTDTIISPLSSEGLDIDSIKSLIKTDLISNDVITDIDYEGSNISILVQIMAYMVYNVNASHALNANQTTLLLTQVRQNIIYLSQQLGYQITRPVSSKMSVTLSVDDILPLDSVVIPKLTKFAVDGYTFLLQEDVTFTNTNISQQVTLIEGTYIDYTIDNTLRFYPDESITKFVLNYDNIENDNLFLRVQKETDNALSDYFTKVNSLVSLKNDVNNHYEEIEPETRYLQIYTSFASQGLTLTSNDLVDVSFILSSGSEANGLLICQFDGSDTYTSNQGSSVKVSVTVNSASSSGSDEESNDSIKSNAPLFYNTGNRTVNSQDYNSFLEKNSLVNSASSWGGESEIPVNLGHVYLCSIPQDTNQKYLTSLEKAGIIKYLTDSHILAIGLRIIQPVYIRMNLSVKLIGNLVLLDDKKTEIENVLIAYFKENYSKFDTYYFENKIIKQVENLFNANNKASIKVITQPQIRLDKELFDNFTNQVKIYIPNSSKRYYLTKGVDRIDLPDNNQDLYSYYLDGWSKTLDSDFDYVITFDGTINSKSLTMDVLSTIDISGVTYNKKDILLDGVVVGYFNVDLSELIFTTDLTSELANTAYINLNYDDEINVNTFKSTVIELGSVSYV
jgi:hypothetical protein